MNIDISLPLHKLHVDSGCHALVINCAQGLKPKD